MKRFVWAVLLCISLPLIACGQQTAEQPLEITVLPAPLQILTSTLPSAQMAVLYSATVVAQGGTLPYTWDISLGALPAGMLLNATTGTIAGTPSATGVVNFTIRVTDASGSTATRDFHIRKPVQKKGEMVA